MLVNLKHKHSSAHSWKRRLFEERRLQVLTRSSNKLAWRSYRRPQCAIASSAVLDPCQAGQYITMSARPSAATALYSLTAGPLAGPEMLSHISYGLTTKPGVWVCSPAGPSTGGKTLLRQGTRLKLRDLALGATSTQLAGVYAAWLSQVCVATFWYLFFKLRYKGKSYK